MITETLEWVSVEERLPGLGQAVLVRVSATGSKHDHAFTLGHVSCGEWYSGEAGEELSSVTHWAEIKGPCLK